MKNSTNEENKPDLLAAQLYEKTMVQSSVNFITFKSQEHYSGEKQCSVNNVRT